MRLSTTGKWLLTGGIAACGLAPWVVGQEPAEREARELHVQHADCVYFGPKRERFLKSGLIAAAREAAALSAATEQVSNQLPPLPPRSRTGALRSAAQLAGIDEILFAAMQLNGVTPAGLTTDQEFLRRVTLDLTGRIPTVPELNSFLADPSINKRAAAVERLLASPQWADKWTMFFGDVLENTAVKRTTNVQRYPDGRNAFYQYIKSSLEQNKPYDQMARELIGATGGNSYTQGELNFAVGGFMTGGPQQDTFDAQARDTATMFLGMAHMDCVLCHDGRRHLDTLSVWGAQATRRQAWGLAGFFARTQLARVAVTPGQPQPYYWSVLNNAGRAINDYTLNTTTGNRPERLPRPGESNRVPPVYPFSGRGPASGEPYRVALGREITSDFQFARAAVNYVWKQFFGLGIVEPPDQFDPMRLDPSNPPPEPWTLQPSNPQLLQRLAQDFVDARYDLKALMRQITNSRAYQLSSRYEGTWNPTWDKYYARKLVRRMDGEEIHDALVQASGIPATYNIQGIGTVERAMQFPDVVNMPGARVNPVNLFLNSFLRGNRDDEVRSRETTLTQALDLMNDPFVLTRARSTPATGLLGRSLGLPDDQLVQNLWVNVLSRYPAETELATALERLRSGGAAQRTANAQNLLWSLYNKVDFIFNY